MNGYGTQIPHNEGGRTSTQAMITELAPEDRIGETIRREGGNVPIARVATEPSKLKGIQEVNGYGYGAQVPNTMRMRNEGIDTAKVPDVREAGIAEERSSPEYAALKLLLRLVLGLLGLAFEPDYNPNPFDTKVEPPRSRRRRWRSPPLQPARGPGAPTQTFASCESPATRASSD